MKKTILVAIAAAAFSLNAFAATDEKPCTKITKADVVMESFFNIIPGYKEIVEKELADSYRCSLAWVGR